MFRPIVRPLDSAGAWSFFPRPGAVWRVVVPALTLIVLAPPACTEEDPARSVVRESIQVHGGDRFENMDVRFTFRDAAFRMVRDDGLYLYERVFVDPTGSTVREWMTNDGTGREVDGTPQPLDPESRVRVETAVHSVVYFGFLPFRLLDPAARHRELPATHILGEPYRVVEVTFTEEGGGEDWEDRFVYWFHEHDGTLDFLAYRYHRGGGDARFRRAVNRREVGGLILQDYENFSAPGGVDDIARFPALYEAGELSLLSMVELRDVTVGDPAPGWSADPHPGPDPEPVFPDPPADAPPADEGIQLFLAMDRASYAPGDSVQALVQVSNLLETPRTLQFSDAQRFDFIVLDQEGAELFRWSAGQVFAQVLGEEHLPPTEAGPRWEAFLPAPDQPGSYRLRAVITARDVELEAELPLAVGPSGGGSPR